MGVDEQMDPKKIFVSHSHDDNSWCRSFTSSLSSSGFSVWYDEQGLQAGQQWVESIQMALQQCDIFILVLSPSSWKSQWVQEELQLAFAQRKLIIPVVHLHTEVTGFITNRQWIDVRGRNGSEAASIVVQQLNFGISYPSVVLNHDPKKKRGISTLISTLLLIVTLMIVVGIVIIIPRISSNKPIPSNTTGSNSLISTYQGTPIGVFDNSKKATMPGTKAPNLQPLLDTSGQIYFPETQIGQSVTVVEFFAEWCPRCQTDVPYLNNLQVLNHGSGVQFISISGTSLGRNYEKGDNSLITYADIQWFADTFKPVYPVLYDPSLTAVNTYGLDGGYPTYYVINRHGIITFETSDFQTLQSEIDKALKS